MLNLFLFKALISDSRSQTEIKEEEGRKLEVPDNNCRQHQQRQINLLDHIDAVQDEVSHRMDFIERELDGKMVRRDEYGF